tara:strand:- start:805 stop:999 length:195 start_codon:yes stop_codon:yes gene_type:complete
MIKKIFFLSLLLLFNNCGVPGSVFLGPAFTGATTKNMARTSLSFASNEILKKVENFKSDQKDKN